MELTREQQIEMMQGAAARMDGYAASAIENLRKTGALARLRNQPLPAEPKPRRRDIGGPFAFDVVH